MAAVLWALLAACTLVGSASATVVGAAVFPHGDFAFDPGLVDNQNGSLQIHQACLELGKHVTEWAPDLIFLSTPHGLAVFNDFALYANTNASGYALLGQDLHNASHPEYKVFMNLSLAPDVVANITAVLQEIDANITQMLAYGDGDYINLRWGEIIPMSFLNASLSEGARTVIFSQPTRRYTQSVAMIPELLTLGAALGDYLETLPLRVAVVISADLAHTHLASGPYGYSPTAVPFDGFCGAWASTLDEEALTVDAAAIVEQALSCGFTGFVMLHGLMRHLKLDSWAPLVYANFAPTYYGMMVAHFDRLSPSA